MTSKYMTLDDILNVLYMQGEDAGKLEYGSATHQITAVNSAKQAILQWVADDIVGQNETNPYIPMVASPTVQVHRDNQRQEQLAKLRDEGWQS